MSECCVRALLICSIVLCIYPPKLSKYPHFRIIFNIFLWILIAITIVIGPLSILIKDTTFYNIPSSSKVIYDISLMFLYFSNIAISLATIFRRNELQTSMARLTLSVAQGFNFFVQFIVFFVILAINTFFILFTQFSRTANLYYYIMVVLVEGFMTWRTTTYLFLIFLLMSTARKNAQTFNRQLLICNNINKVKRCRFMYNNLCNHVENINDLFGLGLFLTVSFFICSFLRHAVFIRINYKNSLFFIVRMLWIVSYGMKAIYLAHIGETLSYESKRTLSICYRMMQRSYPDRSTDCVHKQLSLLAQEASCRQLTVSASGFFNINHSMIMFILTTFCSYLIVTFQILQRE